MSYAEMLLYTFMISGTTIIIVMSISFHVEKKSERKRVENRKKRALQAIVHEDIASDSRHKQKSLKERILKHYKMDEVTPELIDYFKNNYLSVLEEETRKIAEQKALEKQQEQEFNNSLQELERSKEVQLDAFKAVKELGQSSVHSK